MSEQNDVMTLAETKEQLYSLFGKDANGNPMYFTSDLRVLENGEMEFEMQSEEQQTLNLKTRITLRLEDVHVVVVPKPKIIVPYR